MERTQDKLWLTSTTTLSRSEVAEIQLYTKEIPIFNKQYIIGSKSKSHEALMDLTGPVDQLQALISSPV